MVQFLLMTGTREHFSIFFPQIVENWTQWLTSYQSHNRTPTTTTIIIMTTVQFILLVGNLLSQLRYMSVERCCLLCQTLSMESVLFIQPSGHGLLEMGQLIGCFLSQPVFQSSTVFLVSYLLISEHLFLHCSGSLRYHLLSFHLHRFVMFGYKVSSTDKIKWWEPTN